MKELCDVADKIKGVVKFDFVKDGKIIKSETHNNLVVSRSHELIRNLLYNGDYNSTLNILQVGDMNLSYTDDFSNLPQPTLTDATLVHKVFQVNATSMQRDYINNRYVLTLNFNIPKDKANDNNAGMYYKLLCEFGLFSRNLFMFSRMVKPVVKTRDISINVSWSIYI